MNSYLFTELYASELRSAFKLSLSGPCAGTETVPEVRFGAAGVWIPDSELSCPASVWSHVPFRNVYFHWLFDALPQMHLVSLVTAGIPKEWRFTTVSELEVLNIVDESMQFCGISDITLSLKDTGGIPMTCSIHPSQSITNSCIVAPWAIRWLRTRRVNYAQDASGPKRIWISRWHASNRRVKNEREVLEHLASLGFVAVYPETLAFSEQVRLFAGVEVVVGPHGSGLANICFMRPSTTILEVFGPRSGERCFARISRELGLKYEAWSNDSETDEFVTESDLALIESNNECRARWDWEIDVKEFCRFVEANIS